MTLKQHLRGLKHNIVGVAILGFGVLAVLIVGVLAYNSLRGPVLDRRAEQVTSGDIENFKAAQISTAQQQESRQKQSFARQKTISEKQVVGNWDARLEKARALLQIKDGTYRLIVVMDDQAQARRYSNGTYTLKDDLLIMSPNMAWGPPKTQRYEYRLLTRSDIPVIVAKSRGLLVFQIPGSDVDIYVPNDHPLLDMAQDNIAVWDVLK